MSEIQVLQHGAGGVRAGGASVETDIPLAVLLANPSNPRLRALGRSSGEGIWGETCESKAKGDLARQGRQGKATSSRAPAREASSGGGARRRLPFPEHAGQRSALDGRAHGMASSLRSWRGRLENVSGIFAFCLMGRNKQHPPSPVLEISFVP